MIKLVIAFLKFDRRNFAMGCKVYSFVSITNWIGWPRIIFREETARFYQRRMRSRPAASKKILRESIDSALPLIYDNENATVMRSRFNPQCRWKGGA